MAARCMRAWAAARHAWAASPRARACMGCMRHAPTGHGLGGLHVTGGTLPGAAAAAHLGQGMQLRVCFVQALVVAATCPESREGVGGDRRQVGPGCAAGRAAQRNSGRAAGRSAPCARRTAPCRGRTATAIYLPYCTLVSLRRTSPAGCWSSPSSGIVELLGLFAALTALLPP
jgi:hypothetical protein